MQPQFTTASSQEIYSFSSLKSLVDQRRPATQLAAPANETDAVISEIANINIFDCEINTYGTNMGLITVKVLSTDVFSHGQPTPTTQPQESDEVKAVAGEFFCMNI